MPIVLSLVYIGAFEGNAQWGDLYSLLFFGVLGWAMKHFQWPRPPLVLGFILGKVLERYMFISIQRYGTEWMLQPIVIVMFALALGPAALVLGTCAPMAARADAGGLRRAPVEAPAICFPAALACIVVAMLLASQDWGIEAQIIPMIVGAGATLFCVLTLANDVLREPAAAAGTDAADEVPPELAQRARGKPAARRFTWISGRISAICRSASFFRAAPCSSAGWRPSCASMAVIGLIATVPVFIVAYMRLEGSERWSLTLSMATGTTLFVYALFDRLLAIPWPQTLLGAALPALKAIPGV